MEKLKWINSKGGPFVMMGKEESQVWKGAAPSGASSHYDQACNVKGLWGIIQVENVVAIILSDEPVATTWIPFDDGPGGTIVRWIYAENEAEVAKHLESLPQSNWTTDGTINITTELMYVFDSVETVKEAMEAKNLLVIPFKIGKYEMRTQEYKPDEKTYLRLQQFRMVTV
jgi:hypothetical protein